ncbi:bifunctional adenosylcobinamide kinase/adenosylcobinamide-phosphate guanylyltransferase [Lentibacillus cibarius]|uniref:Adenosylcobinamide kinase n=1 Tax=Lentibacillus cibarius TaxID=2583219 RepID=A0A549YJN3_9BACI|nr:bifunctional adenosylcobinamide kinase/adenosylcobinamide-phosphate guanylyltransferase [Lentibacillus cibarius]TRM12090.1 bifunctional adenosylcobinamide kinase/adenosylcobinamide-phosphate guanylyltransferase [Lentibacillus cibarius]
MEKGKLIFVTGGVRSGKSSFAENMAINLSRQLEANLHYIACGVPSDEEMSERIARHRENRTNASPPWKTWECPYHLQRISNYFSKQDILVLDCVTTLLNNYLFECNMDEPDQVIDCISIDIASLKRASAGLIVVSNEVAQGIPNQEPFIRNYQSILGNVHQNIVNRADAAYLVENGIPICKKGAMA